MTLPLPNWDASAHPPMRIDEIQAVAVPYTLSKGISDFPSGGSSALFNATKAHFSGTDGANGLVTLVPNATDTSSFEGASIVVFGFGVVTNGDLDSALDLFAGSVFEEGNDADIYTFSTSLQGPMFQDFDKPIVLAPGKALMLQTYVGSTAGTAIDVVTVRYGFFNVAGK